jgi:hypothetical protein
MPKGIALADAGKFLPAERIARFRDAGALPLASNLLRYELLRAGLGLYVDCDVFCLRPIEDADYIFGWENGDFMNNAVLKMPADCPALAALGAIKDTPNFVAPWRKKPPRRLEWLRGPARPAPLEDLPVGTTGPKALTYYAKRHGIAHLASPMDRFYPLHWDQVELLFDPGLPVEALATPRTDALHLYNSKLTLRARNEMPKHSPLWQICQSAFTESRTGGLEGR